MGFISMIDSKKEALERIRRFPSVRLLVLGDVFLDTYLDCRALGVANEAPVPLLAVSRETSFPGGAANVALNLARLGVQTHLIGVVGKDSEAHILAQLLREARVSFYPIEASSPTIRKTRVLSQNHYYLRLDEEDESALASEILEQLLETTGKVLPNADLVVISDYNKGLFTAHSIATLENLFAEFKLKILADLKPLNISAWRHLDLITPNLSEALAIYSQVAGSDPGPVSNSRMAEDLSTLLNCDVILKLGSDGMIAASQGRCLARFPALGDVIRNSSGAGDSVLATIAAVLACAGSLAEAAGLASVAAGIAVSHEGTYGASSDELIRAVEGIKGTLDSMV